MGQSIRWGTKQEALIGAAVGTAVLLLVMSLYVLDLFEWLELRTYDLRYALLPSRPLETPILLIRFDDESEAKLNLRAADVGYGLHATAVRRLVEAGAAIIAFDIIFSRPSDHGEDAEFAQAIREAGNVVLARYIGEQDHKIPLPIIRNGELGEGLINVVLDSDGVLRSVPLLGFDYSEASAGPEPILTMAVEVARLFLLPEEEHELDLEDVAELGIGPLRIPYPDGRMRIHFYGPPGTFPRVSFWKIVTGEFDRDLVRGKIVLIGASAPSLHDSYQTPYTEKRMLALFGHEETRGVRMDGFEIHANAVQTILDGRFIHRSKDRWGLVPMLLIGTGLLGIMLLILSHGNPILAALAWLGLLAGIMIAGYWLFWKSHYWLDVMPMVAMVLAQASAGVAYQRYLEGRKRRQVQALFGRYVSPQVVEHLVRHPEMANPSGRKERLTIFFSDVRGFTGMSEKMEPQDVQRLLSEYFHEMTCILFKYGGTLDKFMGDGLMAFFGNPEPQPDHARRAVFTALEMQDAVARLNRQWLTAGRQPIGVGMGINTGEVTVGNLGSKDFLDYTVIGDQVNLACRLERLAGAGEIIITQATYDDVKAEIEAEILSPVELKGKSELIPIYRVLRRRLNWR